MTDFVDSLSNLKYEKGMVYFNLYPSAVPENGSSIAIPIDSFLSMLRFLYPEAVKIAKVHNSWSSEKVNFGDAVLEKQLEANPSIMLGPLLSSI